MAKLVDALYQRRRGQQLLGGGRQQRPNISSLGHGGGWAPIRCTWLRRGRRPVGAQDADGMFRCGLRVISVDGSTTNLPDSREHAEYLGRGVVTGPLEHVGRPRSSLADHRWVGAPAVAGASQI